MTKWGQYFLIKKDILEKIVQLSCLTQDDCVIEIGTGLGNLTRYLSQYVGRVITFEIDPDLFQKTSQEFFYCSNVVFINQDFLQVNLIHLLEPFSKFPLKIVANLPYSISTAALFKIIQTPIPWAMVVIMVQKEFAQKILARPGDKRRGPLSVVFQMTLKVKNHFEVSRSSFQPMPKIDSMVLQCIPQPDTVERERLIKVMKLSQYLFRQRRKKIGTLLRAINPSITESATLLLNNRPEELTQSQWIELVEKMNEVIMKIW
jgi:16S rRNA (adenine1518-N6/adenine1519-N6)-dimethyltransferase